MATSTYPPIRTTLLASLLVGGVAAVAANLYRIGFMSVTGREYGEVQLLSTTLASLLPAILAGAGYHVAMRWIPRGRQVFTGGALALTALSVAPVLLAPPHPGFAPLGAPLHAVVGGAIALGVPRLTDRLAAR